MGYFIVGVIFVVLPILTWFDVSLHFVEAFGATLFFWVIGLIMIIVGTDRITPGGIWKTKGQGSGGSSGGTEYERHYNYDAKGNITGWTEVPKK